MSDPARTQGRLIGFREEAGGIRVAEVQLDHPRPAWPFQPAAGAGADRAFRLPAVSGVGGTRLELALLPTAPPTHLSGAAPGTRLVFDPPEGRGIEPADWRDRDLLLIGAMDGVAILRGLLRTVSLPEVRPRSVTALFGARTLDELPFAAEWRDPEKGGAVSFHLALEEPPAGWDGAVGLVPVLFRGLRLDPPATTAVVAGPGALHKFAVLELLMRGVTESAIRIVPERGFRCELEPCPACLRGDRYVCERGPVFPWSEVKSQPVPYF